jgi:hypothetical protein
MNWIWKLDFKINWYNNYKDKINYLKWEKTNKKIDFKYNVDTFKRRKNVFGEEPLIMPNFNDKFTLAINNKKEAKFLSQHK